MSFFNHTTLLQLFQHETVIDAEAEIVRFWLTHTTLTFSLYISPHEGSAIITLTQVHEPEPLYEIGIKDLAKITHDATTIFFYKEEQHGVPCLTITIKPHISLVCDM